MYTYCLRVGTIIITLNIRSTFYIQDQFMHNWYVPLSHVILGISQHDSFTLIPLMQIIANLHHTTFIQTAAKVASA